MIKMKKSRLLTPKDVKTHIRKREKSLDKFDCGKVLVIAGSKGMAGAAVLCAKGALHTGAGLVQVSIAEELFPVIHAGIVEATCVSRNPQDLHLTEYQAVAVGPGLGVKEENEALIKTLLTEYEGTVVADADALNLLAENQELAELCRKKSSKLKLIITPHPREAGRLLGQSAEEINEDREESARLLAKKFNAVAVLKGASTVVATPRGATYINPKGNPGMATAGSGDVLTGVIAALAGQGLSALDAACCGVYLHGLSGDLGAKIWGEYSLTASDIANSMYMSLNAILRYSENLQE